MRWDPKGFKRVKGCSDRVRTMLLSIEFFGIETNTSFVLNIFWMSFKATIIFIILI